MKVLLISKWVAGGTRGDFYYPGVWRDTFELSLALKQIGIEPAILSPQPHPKHTKRFHHEFGSKLAHLNIIHLTPPTLVTFGNSWGRFRWQMFAAELKAIRHLSPDVVQYMEFGPSLLYPLVTQPVIFYGCYLITDLPQRKKDKHFMQKDWQKQPASITDYLLNLAYHLTNRLIGSHTIETIAEKHAPLIFMHRQGYIKGQKKFAATTRVLYIPKGIDLEAVKKYQDRFKVKKNTKAKKQIVYLGAILYAKGVFDLLEAFEAVQQQDKNVQLIIAGTGPRSLVKKLRHTITTKKLNTKYLGSVNARKRWQLLFSADIFCLPSYFDADPSVILEAQAAGLPVVTTSEIDSPIKNGVNGLTSPCGDIEKLASNLSKLIQSNYLRKKMSRQALKSLAKFSWQLSAKKFAHLYKKLTQSS